MTKKSPLLVIFLMLLISATTIVALVVGFLLVQYSSAKKALQSGEEAQLIGECEEALAHFNKLVENPPLLDFGQFNAPAAASMEVCTAYQQAAALEHEGALGDAIQAYFDFSKQYEDSDYKVLVQRTRNRIGRLFREGDPQVVATDEVCGNLSIYMNWGKVWDYDDTIPGIYLACGQYYATQGDTDEAIAYYYRVITDYSDTPGAQQAAELVLATPEACEYSQDLLDGFEHENLSQYAPNMLLTCGRYFQDESNWLNAVLLYDQFLQEYPEHVQAQQAIDGLVVSSVERAKVVDPGDNEGLTPGAASPRDKAVIIIRSNSSVGLRLLLKGEENQIVEIPPCEDCVTDDGSMEACPPDSLELHISVDPGEYEVALDAWEYPGNPSWLGEWKLSRGRTYYNCFYIFDTSPVL